jgi:hypothetical protein
MIMIYLKLWFSTRGEFLPTLGDIWHHLKTFLLVITGSATGIQEEKARDVLDNL